jgi:cyclase
MLAKRIIPCLDIKDGQTVKGVNFENLQQAGNPIELAQKYAQEGADELVFLDITATIENRNTFVNLVKDVALHINIPFTVGGGIKNIQDVSRLLEAGADKITINSAAVRQPSLIDELAKEFGSQCIVVAIDTNLLETEWKVHTKGGREATDLDTFSWAKEIESRGGGEILLTSMVNDGTKNGFACKLTSLIAKNLHIPIIASGGAGKKEHFLEVFKDGYVDAALAASVFHFNEITIPDLKIYLKENGIAVRN